MSRYGTYGISVLKVEVKQSTLMKIYKTYTIHVYILKKRACFIITFTVSSWNIAVSDVMELVLFPEVNRYRRNNGPTTETGKKKSYLTFIPVFFFT